MMKEIRVLGTLVLFVVFYIIYIIYTTHEYKQSIAHIAQENVASSSIQGTKKTSMLTVVVFNSIDNEIPYFPKVLPDNCPYQNCLFTTNLSNLQSQAAIIYSLTYGPCLPFKPPISPSERNQDQVWIFTWLESPIHHFAGLRNTYMNEHWKDTLNWTMTYTQDADIALTFGWMIRKRNVIPSRNFSQIYHKKSRMAAWLVSNCQSQSKREVYVELLKRHGVQVDIYGHCAGKRVDYGTFAKAVNEHYKFYIAFENSLCKDYITEKFVNRFNLDTVLVVRGGGNYSQLAPNGTYINTEDFGSAEQVAKYMLHVASNESLYVQYLEKKGEFYSVYQNDPPCKVCSKLNNLDNNRKVYSNLVNTIHSNTCFEPRDLF